MNIEKQTYLNTELLQSLLVKEGRVVGCYGAGCPVGGVRFILRSKGKVALTAEFRSVSSDAVICLDGLILAETLYPTSHYEVTLSKGEHVFDVLCTGHGGYVLTVEGVGVEEGVRYLDRVGGHVEEDETHLYLSRGRRGAVAYRRTNDSEEITGLSVPLYDDALLYDKQNRAYTTTVRNVSYHPSEGRVYLSTANTESFLTGSGVRSVAISDGSTLENTASFLVMYVEKDGKARLFTPRDDQPLTSAESCVWGENLLRAVSAQRGSILLMQTTDGVWKGYYFHPQGEETLTVSAYNVFHYDEVLLGRNKYTSPSAVTDDEGVPTFYYRKEDGKLMRMTFGETPVEIGYQEGYHPGHNGGYYQYAGEVQYMTEE